MELYKIKKPFVLLIFGASGDLAKLKLFPAIYSLMEQHRLPKDFYVIGFARSQKSQEQFKKEFKKSILDKYGKETNPKILNELLKHIYYFRGQYDKLQSYRDLREYIDKLSDNGKPTKMAYFSVPPLVFKDIIQNLAESRTQKNEDLRLILEKPFGEDTESANALFHFVARYFDEECVYLLDHYLGKSAVQSILTLRHANRLLNIMMKGPEVSNIQITASEDLGVTSRIGYFDQVGTIKDMFQSHLLQILGLIAMSIPISEEHVGLKREKNNILAALKFIPNKKNISLGQYAGYKKEDGVPKKSKTETFAALRLFIDRESWYNTPIYVRTGKKLKDKRTYVVIELKKFGFQPKNEEPNRLVFELQPEEKITIRLVNKQGASPEYQHVSTTDSIACTGDYCLSEHGLLLLDVMRKRRLHFLSFQEIISSWHITDQIIHFVEKNKVKVEEYDDHSEGPTSQHNVTAMDGFKWFNLD